LNIAGEKFAEKIAVKGEDIHEGKRTLMVIHAMKNAPAEKAARLNVRTLPFPHPQAKCSDSHA
jgi:geranylgeranyl pyrophosphate synthase